MIREGRMTPAGLAKIEEAKANGEWDAATRREDTSAVPADLEAALRKRKGAWAAFAAWPASRKKMYLHWINSAKRDETREKRIRAVVEMAVGKEPPSVILSKRRGRHGQYLNCPVPGRRGAQRRISDLSWP